MIVGDPHDEAFFANHQSVRMGHGSVTRAGTGGIPECLVHGPLAGNGRARPSFFESGKHQRGVRAAESEAVGEDGVQPNVVAAVKDDRHAARLGPRTGKLTPLSVIATLRGLTAPLRVGT